MIIIKFGEHPTIELRRMEGSLAILTPISSITKDLKRHAPFRI